MNAPGDWFQKTPGERHRPPHATDAGQAIFLTASTVRRLPHLGSPERRDQFQELLGTACAAFEVELLAWVILKEHYHVVVCPYVPENFTHWIRALHMQSAAAWNEEEGVVGRQVWYQYWDRSLWTDGDLWSRINYIHQNPVKHGYVNGPREWAWSSLHAFEAYWEEPYASESLARFRPPLKVRYDDF
jgi:REP-associated tyrosine transposase